MDTDDGLRLNYNMKQLIHDLISGEVSGVLPMEVSCKLANYVEQFVVPEFLNLKILELINHEAYYKCIENYLQFVLDQNTETQYAVHIIEEEITEVQYNRSQDEDDLSPTVKTIIDAYISSLICLTKILPNIKPKQRESKEPVPQTNASETELNQEIAKILFPTKGSKTKRMELIRKLDEMDKKVKQTRNPSGDVFSIEFLSNYMTKNVKNILVKMEKIRKWQKLIPWKQKRTLEILLNSRKIPWKSYYNIYHSFQNLLGNLAEIYNINFSFRIYWENLSTKINNNFINFIKINSIMEAETDDFKHNAMGYKYNNLIKPKINITKEANKMEDYKIQVLHAINYGNEENLETLWNNELRKNLDEKILTEFAKMKEYMQEQQLIRKYLEKQILPMKSK